MAPYRPPCIKTRSMDLLCPSGTLRIVISTRNCEIISRAAMEGQHLADSRDTYGAKWLMTLQEYSKDSTYKFDSDAKRDKPA